MKFTKRWFSALLLLIMVLSIFTAIPITVSAVTTTDIKVALDSKLNTYKPGSTPPSSQYRSGTYGCFGFVDLLCRQIFGHNLASQKSAMELNSSNNFSQIGSTLSNSAGTLNVSSLSNLFSQSQIGDIVQMDYTTYSGEDSRHTMMVYSVSSSGVVFYHAGSSKVYFGKSSGTQPLWGTDGSVLTWSDLLNCLRSSDDGISIYRSTSSSVNTGNNGSTTDSTNPDDYTMPTSTIYYTSPTMKDSTVSWVQAVLYQLGYSIDVDGSYGKNSEAVVKQFQSDYGLEVDGRVGPATRAKLLELWNAKKAENSHTCDKNISSYQSAHPHYLVYKCSECGKEQVDTTKTKQIASCNSCLPEKSVLTVSAGTSLDYTSFSWSVAEGADCYELKIYKVGDDTPLHWLFNLTTTKYELLLSPGDYIGYVVFLNIDLIDTSNYFVYSDKVEFSVSDGGDFIPAASSEYDGSRYELYNVSIPWHEAKAKCEELGGHLVVITSSKENEIVGDLVSQGGRHSYWMGMSDNEVEGTWVSVTNESLSYTNWMDGEPNNQNNEDYAVIRNVEGKTWNDASDTYYTVLVGFICEYENNNVVSNICGDANMDGSVNIKDATAIQKNVAGLEYFTETQIQLADANNDNAVNIKDATAVQKYIANIDEFFYIGTKITLGVV